jgi:hypothetical protein
MTLFNTTLFHSRLSAGNWQSRTRSDSLPLDTLSKFLDNDASTNVTAPDIPTLAMTLIAARHRLKDLLNPQSLGEAYEVVYRLSFARAMAEILRTDFFTAISQTIGIQAQQVDAVVLEPVFTYLVETLLGVVSVEAMILLCPGHKCHTSGRLVVDAGEH